MKGQAKTGPRKPGKAEPQPAKVVTLRLPRNYTWNGTGYDIRERK